jgi:hypothetical protein
MIQRIKSGIIGIASLIFSVMFFLRLLKATSLGEIILVLYMTVVFGIFGIYEVFSQFPSRPFSRAEHLLLAHKQIFEYIFLLFTLIIFEIGLVLHSFDTNFLNGLKIGIGILFFLGIVLLTIRLFAFLKALRTS